jgi:pyruvate formate lyase activating enzyme
METTGRIFNIQRCSTEDGPGLRTTVFMKGCSMRCAWCHNPEGLNFSCRVMWIESRCQACYRCIAACPNQAIAEADGVLFTDVQRCRVCGACVQTCLNNAREVSGRDITVAQCLDTVKRDRIFYDKSGGGATLSGGEATLQWEFAREFFKACKSLKIHTALDTCGWVKAENLTAILEFTDLVLYDLKVADPLLHRKYTGAGLEPVLENARLVSGLLIPMWIRIPVIPGYTDSTENIAGLGAVIRELPAVRRVDLLPYHRLGEAKYKGLGMKYPLEEGPGSPEPGKMEALSEIISKMLDNDIMVVCN